MRAPLVLAAGVVGLLALSGCASSPSSSSGVTLAVEKSSIQLLRNEAAGRIPVGIVEQLVQPTDQSASCKPVADDPDGLWRTWNSGVLVLIKFGAQKSPDELLTDVVTSFTDQGWQVGTADSAEVTRLEKPTSFATIDMYAVAPDTRNRVGGQIQVDVTGPCVLTAGPDSAEVRTLEGKN